MSKKKHKKQSGQGRGWGETGYGQDRFEAPDGGNPQGPGGARWNDLVGGITGAERGMLDGLQGMVGSRHTEQFVLGALIGAAAVYVLGDEEMRNKLLKSAIKLYSGIAGGFEEIKEQMADIRAEVEAETQD